LESGSLRLVNLCFDANDPTKLATFWAQALRWEMDVESECAITLVPADGRRFELVFHFIPERKSGQNRNHLDLTTVSLEDQVETVTRLLECGASHVDVGQRPNEEHVVLADPEGNEFCVIEPSNSFLGDCGRLGAINCDGTRQTGYFWSAALGWPLVWDHNEETAIRAADGTGPKVTWSGPPLMEKVGKNRLHLNVAPSGDGVQIVEVNRLIALGAKKVDIGPCDVGGVTMADPDGNEFCVLTPR
jgi:predicted enzyme related to lactoylglutathione lyase